MAKYIQKSKNEKKKIHATTYGSAQTLHTVFDFVSARDAFDPVAPSGAVVEVAVVESVPVIAGDGDAVVPEGHGDESPLPCIAVVCVGLMSDGFGTDEWTSVEGIQFP